MGRREPIAVYGPKGIKAMTEHVLKAWEIDIEGRAGGLNQHNPTGWKVVASEITPGVVLSRRQCHRDGVPGAA